MFKLNTGLHPKSFNVYDSLADAYEKAGDKARALESCKKALALEPDNEYEQNRVRGLEGH